jgi:hypothetical protein
MYLQTKSFESPVSLMNEDLLGRWHLAKDVYTVVRETPRDWSCRIGIYGKWGEGKTSLLRFVESQARSDGIVSFWVNPSHAENADDLWQIVLESFIEALDREEILIEEVRAWRVRFLAQKTEPLDRLAELNQYAKALVGFGRAAIKEWLRPDGEQIRKLREKLHANQIVVFVDDLDRTHPTLIPKLLLGLRDLLDLPGFCFVVAFDEEIISKTLTQVNSAWGDGKAFLDKVLDFSFSLPVPKTDQRLELVKYHIRELCPWMNIDVIEHNSDLLPETPRKLKALIRNLMTLGPQMRRHDPGEIQWVDFFMGQLVRLESPGFLDDFLSDDNKSLVEVGAYLPRKQGQSSFEERLGAAIKSSGAIDDALLPRLTKLLKVWSERRVFVGGKNLNYYAGFGSTHRDMTQGEYRTFVNDYRTAQDLARLGAQLLEHAARLGSPSGDVAQEFLRIAVETRGEHLEEAADSEIESDTVEFITKAHECLELISDVLGHPAPPFSLTPSFRCTLIQSIAGQTFKWIHFDVSIYQQTRQEERQLLLSWARQDLIRGLDWLEFLLPWSDETLYFVGGHKAAAQLIEELLKTVQDRITAEALDLFEKEGTYLGFYGAKAARIVRFCFFHPDSPVWQDAGRARFFHVLESPSGGRAVRQNAAELLACLSWTKAREGFSGRPDDLKTILLLPGVAKALWAAATAQPIHYRFQQRLIEIRRAVLQQGVTGDQLPVPQWLARRVSEVEGEPSGLDSAATTPAE